MIKKFLIAVFLIPCIGFADFITHELKQSELSINAYLSLGYEVITISADKESNYLHLVNYKESSYVYCIIEIDRGNVLHSCFTE
jgi:hypothetical protein